MNPFGCLVGVRACLLEIAAERCDAEYASAAGDDLALFIEFGACVEAVIGILPFEGLKACDDLALLITARIAAGSDDNAYSRVIFKHKVDLVERSVNAGLHDIHDIGSHPGQHDLGLGIAEARVVLEDPGAVFSQHQAKIQNAAERPSLCSHGVEGSLVDMLSAVGVNFIGVEGAG